jgi:hypothetical protein
MKNKKTIGRKNTVIKPIPKTLFNFILTIQRELQEKENIKAKNYKPRKITFMYASLQLLKK